METGVVDFWGKEEYSHVDAEGASGLLHLLILRDKTPFLTGRPQIIEWLVPAHEGSPVKEPVVHPLTSSMI